MKNAKWTVVAILLLKAPEKTVLGQERAAENKIYVFDGKNSTKMGIYC